MGGGKGGFEFWRASVLRKLEAGNKMRCRLTKHCERSNDGLVVKQ